MCGSAACRHPSGEGVRSHGLPACSLLAAPCLPMVEALHVLQL